MTTVTPKPLWQPSQARINQSQLKRFMDWLREHKSLHFSDYNSLWEWSVESLEDFWAAFWEFYDIQSRTPYHSVLSSQKMPGATWFEGARLNFSEQAFRFHQENPDRAAIVSRSELRPTESISWAEMRSQIASVAYTLRKMGVEPGDRVVAYLPNIPEAVIAFYACASIGAIWSSCSPDMGVRSVADRFRQIDPKVMLAVDGYKYGGKEFDRLEVLKNLKVELPTLENVILLPYLKEDARLENATLWDDLLGHDVASEFEHLPFDHPLWIVYSSGTTGMPKPIVHGHGGALLEAMLGHGLHLDLGTDDRYFWFSTTGWIMWNCQISGLLLGATICLFDGNPGYPDLGTLWRFAEEAKATFFGAGAAYYMSCLKAGIELDRIADLRRIRSVGSTGSPLPEQGYAWINAQFEDVLIAPISGGTDVAAFYVGSCPIMPLYEGEMQCRTMGTAVYALDDNGEVVEDDVGELVVTKPMPSMPLYFWGDVDGKRYHESYFDVFPGLWRHGDWIRITPRGGAIIYGRSDTTINRQGIRMGTSEIYRVVEEAPEVVDSLVVDLEYLGSKPYMPLFIVLRENSELTDELVQRIRNAIRTQLSARHIPNDIIQVSEIPRTLTGKKMELPVKKLLQGAPQESVANPDAMANPDSLIYFTEFAKRQKTALT
ncbi:acetoacetate--CoA ligase [Marinobacter sp.]|uniref:acetoacetate--CoA ligase n=1 Tax=Marinobacter sp. TaxID=50741 RepID=UPI003F94E08A